MTELNGHKATGTRKQFILYAAIIAAATFGLHNLLGNAIQVTAAAIFLSLVVGTLMFWRFKVAIAFVGVVILLLTRTIDLPSTLEFMNLDVIIFLIGMMVVAGFLRRSGLFRWLLARLFKISQFDPRRMMIIVLVLAAVVSALTDEVTSILFITPLVLDLCDYFRVNPINQVISVVLATNIGSSWTVLGNPVGILIALRSGLTFFDFLQWALPVGIISLVCLIAIVLFWQRGPLRLLKAKVEAIKSSGVDFMSKWAEVKDRRLFRGSVVIFLGVIVALALHHQAEFMLGLGNGTLLVGASVLGAGIAMLWHRGLAREILKRDVDWWTLVFFMFLFAKAGALKYVGLTDIISDNLLRLSGGNMAVLIPAVLWISGFASAAADNVVVVSTFVPILQNLSAQMGTPVLWWALLFGGCFGGNLTMVGSTANIVALGILEDRKRYSVKFSHWVKIGFVGSLVPMVIGTAALLIFGAS
jgi:Na+/H+ antiporter NhaD/arsenite permease-like protein